MKTQEAVKGRWAEVFKVFNLPPITGKKAFKGECPICKRRGKFRIDDKDGTGSFICVCNVGDGWALLNLTQGKEFKELAAEVDQIIGNSWKAGPKPEKTDAQKHRDRVIKKMPSLVGLEGTDGEKYLVSRGITVLPTDGVRFCTNQRVHGEICEALYSVASDSRGELCYLHRTLLKDGKKYTKWGPAKKMLRLQEETYIEHASSVAIRLFSVASTLGIAEGIETALAAYQISHCHTWATLNTTFMRRFIAPGGVKHLIIFADSDKSAAGHAAAFECAFRNLNREGDLETVSVRWPETGDFNDVITTGARVFEWIFRKENNG